MFRAFFNIFDNSKWKFFTYFYFTFISLSPRMRFSLHYSFAKQEEFSFIHVFIVCVRVCDKILFLRAFHIFPFVYFTLFLIYFVYFHLLFIAFLLSLHLILYNFFIINDLTWLRLVVCYSLVFAFLCITFPLSEYVCMCVFLYLLCLCENSVTFCCRFLKHFATVRWNVDGYTCIPKKKNKK